MRIDSSFISDFMNSGQKTLHLSSATLVNSFLCPYFFSNPTSLRWIHGLVKNKAEFILPVLSLVLWLGNDFMSLAHGGDRPFERIGGLEIAMFVVEEEGFVAFPVVVYELEVLHAGGWSVV